MFCLYLGYDQYVIKKILLVILKKNATCRIAIVKEPRYISMQLGDEHEYIIKPVTS